MSWIKKIIKHIWFKLTHRHDWKVIWRHRTTFYWIDNCTGKEFNTEGILELDKCWCGKERGIVYDGRTGGIVKRNPKEIRFAAMSQNVKIPAIKENK